MFIDLTLKVNLKNATSKIASLGHYGTHMDVMENTEIPIEKFVTTGKLIDVTAIRKRLIETKDIENEIEIQENDFIIFRSLWLKDHGYGTRDYFLNHPHFSDAAIDYLLDKKIAFIGLDFPGAQRKEKHALVDEKCASNNVHIIENLNNLDLIPQQQFRVYCFPMHLAGNTGIPVRIMIEI